MARGWTLNCAGRTAAAAGTTAQLASGAPLDQEVPGGVEIDAGALRGPGANDCRPTGLYWYFLDFNFWPCHVLVNSN